MTSRIKPDDIFKMTREERQWEEWRTAHDVSCTHSRVHSDTRCCHCSCPCPYFSICCCSCLGSSSCLYACLAPCTCAGCAAVITLPPSTRPPAPCAAVTPGDCQSSPKRRSKKGGVESEVHVAVLASGQIFGELAGRLLLPLSCCPLYPAPCLRVPKRYLLLLPLHAPPPGVQRLH